MKRIALLSAIICISLSLTLSVSAADPGFVVDLTTQKGYDVYYTALNDDAANKNHMYSVCSAEVSSEGYTRFTTTKSGDIWITVQTEVDISQYKFISIKYRASSALEVNSIYSKDNTDNKGYSGTVGTYCGPNMTTDNEWHVRTINVATELSAAKGIIKGIRIPLVKEIDGTLDIEYIAAFETEADSSAYVHTPEPNTETGVVSLMPALVLAAVSSLSATKKRK